MTMASQLYIPRICSIKIYEIKFRQRILRYKKFHIRWRLRATGIGRGSRLQEIITVTARDIHLGVVRARYIFLGGCNRSFVKQKWYSAIRDIRNFERRTQKFLQCAPVFQTI